MIGRRHFSLGLAAMLAATGEARRVRAEDMPKKKKRLDVPFTPLEQIPNHRQMMRDIVIALSAYAKQRNPRFVVLARNGSGLLVKETREWKWETLRDPDNADKYSKVGTVNRPYLKAIDGMLVDGPSYGGAADYGKPTDGDFAAAMAPAIEALRREGRRVLAIDYCDAKADILNAEAKAAALGAIEYVDRDGDKRLGTIPHRLPAHESASPITDIDRARNFLPMLRSDSFGNRTDWVEALKATNYDVLLIDTFWREAESVTFAQASALKYKRVGSDRLLFGVLPLGLARDTRFYWKPDWRQGNPPFLVGPDPDDPSSTIVNYWDAKWKEIVGRYMQGIIDLGVDGILLDQVDAYLYFEDLMPLQ